ncbi:redoxin domain-containing protein [candidate division KSB1 bacterium]|nr:redoxin domain-containing protein [candidate division KSB1 bacterium]
MFGKLLVSLSIIFTLFIAVTCADSTQKVDNFTLSDYDQQLHNLDDYTDSKAIVLMFISTRCPVSNSFNERMEKLYQTYSKKGVTFLGLNSNSLEDINEIKKHALDKNLNFTILKDTDNIIADRLGARVTPEIFVINSERVILYHGRIDDANKESDVKSADLKNALDEILAEKPVTTPVTKVFGCSIKRTEKK